MTHRISSNLLLSTLVVLVIGTGTVFTQRNNNAQAVEVVNRRSSGAGNFSGKFNSGPKRYPTKSSQKFPSSGGGRNSSSYPSNQGNQFNFNDLFKAIPNNPPTNRRSTRDNYNDYDDRDYYYNEPRYTRPQQPVRPRPVAKVKANKKPPEQILAPRDNVDPSTPEFGLVDAESVEILGDLAEEKAQKSVDDVQDKLGDVAKEPAVADKLDELRDKIDNGEQVTEDDIDELGDLVKMVDGAKFPPGFDANELRGSLDDIIDASKANEYMKQVANGNGNQDLTIGLPNGQVLVMPALPDGDMMMLPDGGMLVGTGGEGEFGLADQDARELLGINLGVGDPEPDSAANVAKRIKSGTYLMNENENNSTIEYIISNTNFSMDAGQTQILTAGRTWVIRFDRGGGNGEAEYTLSDGTYMFGAANGGWELFKRSFSVTIDNADNDNPFYFNIDNQQVEVAARGKKTYNSPYPILVRFDRGSGENKPSQKRILEKQESLVVAVNPRDGLWDLYPERNFEGIARKSDAKKSKLRQTLLREKLRLSVRKSKQ